MNKRQLIAVAFGLVLLAGGFAAGVAVGKSGESGTGAPSAGSPTAAGPGGQGGFPGAPGGAGIGVPGQASQGANGQQFVIGRVVSINDTALTLEVTRPGSQGSSPTVTTQIVLLGSDTRVARTAETSIKASDLKANDQVQVAGTSDSSGRISATAIVVGSSTLVQPAGQGPRPSGSPSPTR